MYHVRRSQLLLQSSSSIRRMQSVYHVRRVSQTANWFASLPNTAMQSVYHVTPPDFAVQNPPPLSGEASARTWGLRLSRGKKVAHTVHGFPALQESLRLLSDLMLPKHETILNTAVLLFLCGERESPLASRFPAPPPVRRFSIGCWQQNKTPVFVQKTDTGVFVLLPLGAVANGRRSV